MLISKLIDLSTRFKKLGEKNLFIGTINHTFCYKVPWCHWYYFFLLFAQFQDWKAWLSFLSMTEWLLKGVCYVTNNSNKLAVTDTIFKYKAIMKSVTSLFFPCIYLFTLLIFSVLLIVALICPVSRLYKLNWNDWLFTLQFQIKFWKKKFKVKKSCFQFDHVMNKGWKWKQARVGSAPSPQTAAMSAISRAEVGASVLMYS